MAGPEKPVVADEPCVLVPLRAVVPPVVLAAVELISDIVPLPVSSVGPRDRRVVVMALSVFKVKGPVMPALYAFALLVY